MKEKELLKLFEIEDDDVNHEELLNEIEMQRELITEMLNKEFMDRQIADIWHEINELIELELNAEMDCNK